MKKINLILIALMALIFVSCSEDETTMSISKEANAVAFSTYTGRSPQTRGAEMTESVLQGDDGFGVLAYYTNTNPWADNGSFTPNFMWNQQVKYVSENWSYSPIKYWPTTKGDKISFFAYAPYNGQDATSSSTNNYGIKISGNDVENNPTITFTVQDNPKDMVDLVTASVIDRGNKETTNDDQDGSTLKTPGKVNFQFKHALSRVNFIAKASEELNSDTEAANKTIINITDVKLDKSDQFYKSGVYTISSTADKGVWTLNDNDKAGDAYSLLTDDFLAKIEADHGGYKESGIQLQSATTVSLFTENQYLFLIPPTKDGLTENKATVTFTYDIVTIDANLEKGYSKTTATKTVALPEGTLKQGVAYNYTFTFKVDQVVVTAEVASWGDEVGIPQDDDKLDVDYTHPN